ncbi:MAG: sugar kinase [Anaerolineaceae bacterium]|nr:sugar kinase [Anaerolineaceae bacterium]
MKADSIFVFGDINLDISMPVPDTPKPGRDVYLDHILFNLGGSATNTCIALTQLGLSSRLFGSIGTDPNSQHILKEMVHYGIGTEHILRKPDKPSGHIFLTIFPNGERTMYSFRGANTLTAPEDIPSTWTQESALLHLSGYTFLERPQRDTALKLIAEARDNSIPISMDTGMDPVLISHNYMKPILDKLEICICGRQEGAVLTGRQQPEEIIRSLIDLGVSCAVIKLGSEGCLVGMNDKLINMPALAVPVVDTTGSGDAFSAGILYAWKQRLPLIDMCILANGLGAFKAMRLGSISTNLSHVSILSFLRNIRDKQEKELQEAIDNLMDDISSISGDD